MVILFFISPPPTYLHWMCTENPPPYVAPDERGVIGSDPSATGRSPVVLEVHFRSRFFFTRGRSPVVLEMLGFDPRGTRGAFRPRVLRMPSILKSIAGVPFDVILRTTFVLHRTIVLAVLGVLAV